MNNYFDSDNIKYEKIKENKMDMMNKEYGCGYLNKQMMLPMCPEQFGGSCEPIYECPQERVCHRVINYEVPHIMPCNTRVINHHVYRHTFTPCYTTCEENVVSNVYDRNCCF